LDFGDGRGRGLQFRRGFNPRWAFVSHDRPLGPPVRSAGRVVRR
jgi:hypothetical protein